ncbi:Enoyl reductase [Podospora appendiculata]|uniref:Enoyl reductase n=1 Tax=Podospora appendiculata TaxID=314037 RepID=A0AAE0XGK0_9PEZI|nr:Enoyl reductase [Podospora appendiculata]
MSLPPSKQRALKIVRAGELEVVDDSAIPCIEADEVLVRVQSVAVNPADAKASDLSPTVGATVGCDFAGEVVLVGASVRKQLSACDRVCGPVFGNNPLRLDNGAFAEYVAAAGDLVFKIPQHIDFDQAATLPCGLATVGLALHQSLKVPLPSFSGLLPIATCSPARSDWIKSLGAVATFDYRSPTVGSDIRSLTHDSMTFALDCITTTSSMAMCYEALASSGGNYVSLDPFPIRSHTRRSVRPSWVFGLTMFGTPVRWQRPFNAEAKPNDRAFSEQWFLMVQELLNDGLIKTCNYEVRQGGLSAIAGGIDEVRKGLVSGKKLVYQV